MREIPAVTFFLFSFILTQAYSAKANNIEVANQGLDDINVELSSSARKVRSYSVNGDAVTSDSTSGTEQVLSRRKRSTGAGVASEFTFTLEALEDFASTQNFHVGSLIHYRLTIWASSEQTDVKVEIFSELKGRGIFMISNVRFGVVGGNFNAYDKTTKEVLYYSKLNESRWDYASIDLGQIYNDQTDANTQSASEMELLFEAQALNHEHLQVDESYRISVGVLYGSDSRVVVMQDDLVFKDYTAATTPTDASFSISGPSELTVGTTGVWTITAHLHDLEDQLSVDVLAPLHEPGAMAIDAITIAEVGENYKYSIAPDDIGNFSRTTYDSYGSYATLELGSILNAGYHKYDPNNDLTANKIVFEVAITALEMNETSPYVVGFTVWKKNIDSVEIMWSAQQSVQCNNNSLPALPSSPDFTIIPSASTVKVGGKFGVLLNITLPSDSSAAYQFEISGPVNDSKALMNIERVRMSKVGYNMPHLTNTNLSDPRTESIDNIGNDYAVWDLGTITNTGKKDGTDDNTIQVEVALEVLSTVQSYYSSGDDVPIILGVKHADSYYWVGKTLITITTNNIAYTAQQIPTFTMTNIMSDENKIYTESAAVIDLEMVIPPGVDYRPFTFELNTQYDAGNGKAKLKIIDYEVIYAGKAILYAVDDANSDGLTGLTDDLDPISGEQVNSSAHLQFTHVTSLRDSDYHRYNYEESTIIIRTTVIARGDSAAGTVNASIYWVETTVDFASTYIYAGRLGLTYYTNWEYMYTNMHWQPRTEYHIEEGFSDEVKPGGVVKYNSTFSLPYTTSADVRMKISSEASKNIQVCKMKITSRGKSLIQYDSSSYEGPKLSPDPSTGFILYIESHHPMITSYGEGYWRDEGDTELQYELIAMLTDQATLGHDYNMAVQMDVGSILSSHTATIKARDVARPSGASTDLPVVNITHVNGSNTININGSELFQFDVYTPPDSQYDYTIKLLAPYNSTHYGDYYIVRAYMVHAGSNLPCFQLQSFTWNLTLSKSTDNSEVERENLVDIPLGSLVNTADAGTETMIDENKVSFIAWISVPHDSSLQAGDVIPIAATVDLEGESIWVGYLDVNVIEATDNLTAEEGPVSLVVSSPDHDDNFYVAEKLRYEGKLTVQKGVALTEFKILIGLPLSSETGEPLALVSDTRILGYGDELTLAGREATIEDQVDEYGRIKYQVIHFGYIRNPGMAYYEYGDPASTDWDDQLVFEFYLTLMDDDVLYHDSKVQMLTKIIYGPDATEVDATGETELTITSPDTDRAEFTWTTDFVENLGTMMQDDEIMLETTIVLSSTSKRFPENVTISVRVPEFSPLNATATQHYYNKDADAAFTPPTETTATGLQFSWGKLRHDDDMRVTYVITADPTRWLPHGLGNITVSIPIDVKYDIPVKTTGGTETVYSEMRAITFVLNVPEIIDALGVASSATVKDCQITASSQMSGSEAHKGRLGATPGWSTLPRGEPFSLNEYIQVDMGADVLFTGITFQPYDNAAVSRVNTFRVQYSRLGYKWEDVYVDGNLAQTTYTVTWDSPTANNVSFVAFGDMKFVARYIRIIPLSNSDGSTEHKLRFELHGYCYPVGCSLPEYTCPSADTLESYDERQILGLDDSQRLYACMIPEPGKLPYCSGATEFGQKWFAIDDNVLNILGYVRSTKALYALARDRKNFLKSTDFGFRWFGISKSEYTTAAGETDFILHKTIPFPPVGGTDTSTLFSNYGTEIDTTHTWSVSPKGIHANPGAAASYTVNENLIAHWGSKAWN